MTATWGNLAKLMQICRKSSKKMLLRRLTGRNAIWQCRCCNNAPWRGKNETNKHTHVRLRDASPFNGTIFNCWNLSYFPGRPCLELSANRLNFAHHLFFLLPWSTCAAKPLNLVMNKRRSLTQTSGILWCKNAGLTHQTSDPPSRPSSTSQSFQYHHFHRRCRCLHDHLYWPYQFPLSPTKFFLVLFGTFGPNWYLYHLLVLSGLLGTLWYFLGLFDSFWYL